MEINKKLKKDDLRLDSRTDSRDQIELITSKNEFSFLQTEKKNQIFSEEVKNYIKSKDISIGHYKIEKLLKYCIPYKDSSSKLLDNSFIVQETSLNFEQDSFHNEVEHMIKTNEKEVTEGSILERNKQKFLNLNPVLTY
jgi:hypothetical protein